VPRDASVEVSNSDRPELRKPDWLRIRLPGGEEFTQLKGLVSEFKLRTVCNEAQCPNVGDCWSKGTATLMLMGDICTRTCKFCMVKSGNPKGQLDAEEPNRVARAIASLGLRYVVLTSVDRDDLPDGGAEHFAKTVKAIKDEEPSVFIEVLIPDLQGNLEDIRTVVESEPDVVAHNIEAVKRLTPQMRDKRAGYNQSLKVLEIVKKLIPNILTKSSIMVGLGETGDEVMEVMRDLRGVKVNLLTIGQYLQPSRWHIPVVEYVHPKVFRSYREEGLKMGFLYVASGPLVRSSYRAGEFFVKNVLNARGSSSSIRQRVDQ